MTSLRLLSVSALVLVIISLLITVTDSWPLLLGAGLRPHTGPLVAAACLGIIAVTLPIAIGQRILTGLGMNHVSIALMGLQSPLVLATLIVVIKMGVPAGDWLAVMPYSATFLLSAATFLVAAHKISPSMRVAFNDALQFRRAKGHKVSHIAWPMLVQMIALPIAMQTDRLILSHVSPIDQLATYNLAAQMFTPLWLVASSAGLALWPVFARLRTHQSDPTESPSPLRLSGWFGLLALAGAVIIGALATPLANLASGGAVQLPWPLIIWFGVLILVQCLKVPMGMFLTDAPGLRLQAWFILLMVPLNVGLSWLLAHPLGATGPVIGSAVGVLLCQVIPCWAAVRRRIDHPSDAGRGVT